MATHAFQLGILQCSSHFQPEKSRKIKRGAYVVHEIFQKSWLTGRESRYCNQKTFISCRCGRVIRAVTARRIVEIIHHD